MVITMAKLRMAHASTHGARKPPGPKEEEREKERLNDGDNNGQATHGARMAQASRLGQHFMRVKSEYYEEHAMGTVFNKNVGDVGSGDVLLLLT